jgi:hypothetical protein
MCRWRLRKCGGCHETVVLGDARLTVVTFLSGIVYVVCLCVQVAVEEMRRLQRFGLTAGELERYIQATMRDRCD